MCDRLNSVVRFFTISAVLFLFPVAGFGQTGEMERRRVEMQDRAKKMRANLQLIQEQVRQESMRMFYVKDDLQLVDIRHTEIIWIHDQQRYRWLSDAELYSRIFGETKTDELLQRSQFLVKKWPAELQSFLGSGDMATFESIVDKLKEYDLELDHQMTTQQGQRLEHLKQRDWMFIHGINVESLESVGGWDELDPRSRQQLVDELETLRIKLCVEFNQLFGKHVEKILPGFVDFSLINPVQSRVFPVCLFLELADNPETCRQNWSIISSGIEVDVMDKLFVFPPQVFQVLPGGRILVNTRGFNSAAPTSMVEMVIANVDGDLAEFQLPPLHSFYAFGSSGDGAADPGEQIRQMAHDPKQLKKVRFESASKKNEEIEAVLTPRQIAGIRNYVRLHSLFTVGPHVVFDQLDTQSKPNAEDFEAGIQQLREEIAVMSNDAVQRYSRVLASQGLDDDWLKNYQHPEFAVPVEFLLRKSR